MHEQKNQYMPSTSKDDLRMQLKLGVLTQCPVSLSGPFNNTKVQQKINSRRSKGKIIVVCFIFNSMEEKKDRRREERMEEEREEKREGKTKQDSKLKKSRLLSVMPKILRSPIPALGLLSIPGMFVFSR